MMWQIWPEHSAKELDEHALQRLYRYSTDGGWVAANCVTSADGAATVNGVSGGLATPADRVAYGLSRDLADVVLVGAGTAVAEGYGSFVATERTAERRRRHGLSTAPRIAVISGSGSLPVSAGVLTECPASTIVITCAACNRATVRAWATTGAEVVEVGDYEVDMVAALRVLAERGLTRIDCEGGPTLLGSLLAAGLVDELRLTVSPVLVAGSAGRIASGDLGPAGMRLDSVIADLDGTVLLRYRILGGNRLRIGDN